MTRTTRAAFGKAVLLLAITLIAILPTHAGAAPEGQVAIAAHVTLAPRWLDPAETESAISPFMVLYAIHDAMTKPMPGGVTTPSLAESWTTSKDGLTYEFVVRNGVKFHNGEPVTAEDVKFSFDRYKGGAAKLLKERVREVRVVDARKVRFVVFAPIWENGFIRGVSAKVEEPALTLIPAFPYVAPFEELRLKK